RIDAHLLHVDHAGRIVLDDLANDGDAVVALIDVTGYAVTGCFADAAFQQVADEQDHRDFEYADDRQHHYGRDDGELDDRRAALIGVQPGKSSSEYGLDRHGGIPAQNL